MAANPKYIQPAGQPVTLPPAVPSDPIWRLSVRQYHWMTRAGMFTGISCYWIINLPEKQIEVYTSPSGSGSQPDYQQRQDYFPTDDLPLVLDGQEIGRLAVRSLLP